MLHGNAGQASYRSYVLDCLGKDDGLFVVEYPGYGDMTGRPSSKSLNEAARSAYQVLKKQFPEHRIWVLGESLGSGPASLLAKEPEPPAGIVLAVPFCRLRDVAVEKFGRFLVTAFMTDDWDNAAALAGYKGPVIIYGATQDQVIPFHHARKLADQLPGSIFREINCGHNDWASPWYVDLKEIGEIEEQEAG
jgi:pimeloyl-ACP methyl ester carboxylesterase